MSGADRGSVPERLSPLLRESDLGAEWEAAQAAMPEGRLPFLLPEAVAESGRWVGLDPDAIPYLQETAEHIAGDADLSRLAWQCHYLMFVSETDDPAQVRGWPVLVDLLGERCGAFYLLMALSGVPGMRAFHRARGIPERVMRDTCSDFPIWAQHYREEGIMRDGGFDHPSTPGMWGLDTRLLSWVHHHLVGDLYRLVRLQFMQRPYRYRFQAFRHRETRKVVLLAEAGIQFRGDGQVNGIAGRWDTEAGWTTRLRFEAGRVTGTPMHPEGRALREEVRLGLDAWECILKPGDSILEMHIPADGRLDFEACGESFRQADAFFRRYFPDRPFRAFCCGSWFLDPVYQELLPEGSNIARFQRECYLLPLVSSGGRSGLERIFGRHARDLSTAPRNTTLRRAVLDHLRDGGLLRGGGILLFPEDLDWGTQVYLRRFRR